MHSDSLETGKYIISIKGTDEITEIHLTYKHPKLETLIGKMFPQIKLTDMSRNPLKWMNPILQLYVFGIGIVVLVYGNLQL